VTHRSPVIATETCALGRVLTEGSRTRVRQLGTRARASTAATRFLGRRSPGARASVGMTMC